jgi:DNA modification methylase
VIAGNKTLERAVDLGMDDVIVVETDGTKLVAVQRTDLDLDNEDGKARALATYDNRSGQLDLDWDIDALSTVDVDVLKDLWTVDELDELGIIEKPQGDAEPQIDRAAELQEKWQVKTGDLWKIGEHRLLCGDSTKRDDVEKVMGGEKIELVWTDPPYGVAVGDKNKYLNSIARSNRIEENLENDTLEEAELVKMLCQSFDNMIVYCTAGAGWYVAAPAGPLHILFGQVLKDRGIWRQTIQWVKNNSTFSPMGVCYHWQAEPIFFGWLPNGGHRYYGGRKQTTVWNIDRPLKSPEHPTMKPVELVARAVVNTSQECEIVADPFVGSGTTIVACQNLGRKCRAIEISPKYCSVTLQRMATAFPGIEIERM